MTPHEHLLQCISEECCEIQHAISKALRFGLRDKHPDSCTANRDQIAMELIDLKAAWLLAQNKHLIPKIENEPELISLKQSKILKWMNYAESQGTIADPK